MWWVISYNECNEFNEELILQLSYLKQHWDILNSFYSMTKKTKWHIYNVILIEIMSLYLASKNTFQELQIFTTIYSVNE